MSKHLIVLSISSDIGFSVAKSFLESGWRVSGTYRKHTEKVQTLGKFTNCNLYYCDLSIARTIDESVLEILRLEPWDVFLSAVGEPLPLSPFFETSWEKWAQSFEVNTTMQLKFLHSIWRNRSQGYTTPTALFFSAGGTNGAVRNFSAYTSAKIHLIKMAELLASEDPTTRYVVAGPGWTPSKTHEYMLKNLDKSDPRYLKISNFISSPSLGTSHQEIINFLHWVIAQDHNSVSGRNFSIANDPWNHPKMNLLLSLLAEDENMFKLRRSGNDLLDKQ